MAAAIPAPPAPSPVIARGKAFAIHLSISALIATIVVSTMYFVW